MSKYVEIYKGVKVPDTASHVKTDGLMLFYRNINDRLEFYSDTKERWVLSLGILEDVVELPLAATAINWNEAPKWADSVARADWNDRVVWCCSSQYQYIGIFEPYQIINTHTFTLIEKRPEPAAWMPEVGQECEITDNWNSFERPRNMKDGQKVTILMNYKCPATGSEGVVFTWIEAPDIVRTEWTSNGKHFRPIKTEAEKKRNAFMSQAKAGLSFDMKYNHVVDSVLEQLADNGFKAPEGDES